MKKGNNEESNQGQNKTQKLAFKIPLNLEVWDEEGDGREVQKAGDTRVLWPIHVEVWQKTTKFCEAIILQLKNK